MASQFQDSCFNAMTAQGQQGVAPQGQTTINTDALTAQGYQDMMASAGQSMSFNFNAQPAQGMMYPTQYMGNPMAAQDQSGMSYFGGQPTTNARVPLGVIPDGVNRCAAQSDSNQPWKGPINNGSQGIKRKAEANGQGAARKRRAKGGSSKSTPINSKGSKGQGLPVNASGSSTQDLISNSLGTNTSVPGQDLQNAFAANSPAAFNAAATPQLAPPLTQPHGVYSTAQLVARKDEILRVWERFKRENDILELCNKQPVLSEREKYQDYLERRLETEKATVRSTFRRYLTAGLPALVRDEPVSEPEGFDGSISAAVDAAKAARQAAGHPPLIAREASDNLLEGKIEEQMAKLEDVLPAGVRFGTVKYAKARPQEMKLAALPAPHAPGGNTGPRIGTCHIVRGEGNRRYGGHRGGDFVFRYRGRRHYGHDDPLRFEYQGQVPRTSAEYIYRMNAIAPRVWDVLRAVLGFDPYSNTVLAQPHRPGVLGLGAVSDDGLGSVRQEWEARFGVNGTAPAEFKTAMKDALCNVDVMREFGWLGWKLQQRGATMAPYYALVMRMMTTLTGMGANSLGMSYEQGQEETAKGLAFVLGEYDDRVVVCLESVYGKLFAAHDNPDDPLLHIREPVDVAELAKNALATSAAEVYHAHLNGIVQQFSAPDNDASSAQPDQDGEVSLEQQDNGAAPPLPEHESIERYFQQLFREDADLPQPDQDQHDVSFVQLLNDDAALPLPELRDAEVTAEPENDNWLSFVDWGDDEDLFAQLLERESAVASTENQDAENQDAEAPAEPQPDEPTSVTPDNPGNPPDQNDFEHPVVQRLLLNLLPYTQAN